MGDTDYFASDAIGSSLLAHCIVSHDPLIVCTDRTTLEKKPTPFMEMGRIFEDFVQAEYDPEFDFWEKYFKSNLSSFPAGILEILEAEDLPGAVQRCIADVSHYKLDGGLKKTYELKFHCLNQIKAHDYRRPIPAPWWDKLEIMLKRFKNYPLRLTFDDNTYVKKVDFWMKAVTVLFQVAFFWESEGVKCRAKFDMLWLIKIAKNIYAVPLDLKCTGGDVDGSTNFGAFIGNWKKKYIWQSKHYYEGFLKWCQKKEYIPYDGMPYVIQESEEPQTTHVWSLHPDSLKALALPYYDALHTIQKWIDEGKPVTGFMPQMDVNEYGKEWRYLKD